MNEVLKGVSNWESTRLRDEDLKATGKLIETIEHILQQGGFVSRSSFSFLPVSFSNFLCSWI